MLNFIVRNMKKAYHIAIEGTIGVGKTSLAKLISDKLDSKLILKNLKIIHFCRFYKDSADMLFKLIIFSII